MTAFRTIRIDRCVCHRKSLEHLKQVADREGATSVDDLQKHVEFGTGCGYCKPYVREMLKTGETVFDRVIRENANADD